MVKTEKKKGENEYKSFFTSTYDKPAKNSFLADNKNNSLYFYSKMSPKRVHIIKRDNGWAVKKQGAQRATKIYTTKEDAKSGTKRLQREGHDIIIHKRDGSIEQWRKGK